MLYYEHPILVPKWRAIAGLLILLGLTAAVFATKKRIIIGEGMAASLFLLLVSVLFEWPLPTYRYAAVRHVDSDGYIRSDEIYLRSAPVVKMLEREGSRTSPEGGWFGIERYLYSPRIGLVLGKSLGDGNGSPAMDYEVDGFTAWLFGIRAACEEFAILAINFTPALLLYGAYCHHKRKPLRDSLALEPSRAMFLIGPFCLGLVPLLGV